jgi:hypothetical protein
LKAYREYVTDLSVNSPDVRLARSPKGQQARGGHRSPAPGPAYPGVVVTVGDVLITVDSVLVPQGRFPLAGTTWTVRDSTRVVATTPRYARLLAFGLAFLIVPLLLLRIKDRHLDGFVQVTVVGEGLYHTVQFPPGPESTAHVASLVNEARALAAASAMIGGRTEI